MDIPEGFNLDILKRFGLEHAPEKWDEFFARAGEAIMIAVIRRVEKELPEEKAEEFLRLFEGTATDEEKKSFLDAHIPNFGALMAQEIGRFRTAALAQTPHTTDRNAVKALSPSFSLYDNDEKRHPDEEQRAKDVELDHNRGDI
ncbi:MAG: hypothetical protein Greene071436_17 [Parcubacteria group bacterium Greene0714_36]|nr:MAG: hypothetical protein Greene071436_17 [Parcubacteria group bacterium Greene0714_36]